MSQVAEKPKIVGESIELAGDREECGHCEAGDKFFSQRSVENPKVVYNYYPLGTPKGDALQDEGGSDGIPTIKHCKIDEHGNKVECEIKIGFDPKMWRNLGVDMDVNKPLDLSLTSDLSP